MKLVVRPEALLDVVEASLAYEDEREGLGWDFEGEVDRVMSRIAENPLQFADRFSGIRLALTRRFPYGVFFAVDERQITVIAVHHLHRMPGSWRHRL